MGFKRFYNDKKDTNAGWPHCEKIERVAPENIKHFVIRKPGKIEQSIYHVKRNAEINYANAQYEQRKQEIFFAVEIFRNEEIHDRITKKYFERKMNNKQFADINDFLPDAHQFIVLIEPNYKEKKQESYKPKTGMARNIFWKLFRKDEIIEPLIFIF